MKIISESVIIDETLRFVLFGLQCTLGVQFSGMVCESVFSDSQNNQVNAKSYIFHESRNLIVKGQVEEYEPEIIILTVSGREINLSELVELARYEVHRMRNNNE